MALLLTTAYFPSVSYMASCLRSDGIFIEAFETYTKQTLRNHCRICGPNGLQILSIPVNKINGNNNLTKDVRIARLQPWQRIHWRSIETAYNNSPFFLYYRDYFEPFFEQRFVLLIDLNLKILETILLILRAEIPVNFTDRYEKKTIHTDQREYHVAKHFNDPRQYPEYHQVFKERHGFIPNLSFLDLLFNLGPETREYLENIY